MRYALSIGCCAGALVLALGLLAGGCSANRGPGGDTALAARQGEQDARRDLARGVRKELTSGYPVPWLRSYQEAMKSRYNVEVEPVALTIASRRLEAYVSAYDRVSMAEVNRQYGRDVFTATADQAQAAWTEAHEQTASGTTE